MLHPTLILGSCSVQHVEQWPNAHNMLRATMLHDVPPTCCIRLARALSWRPCYPHLTHALFYLISYRMQIFGLGSVEDCATRNQPRRTTLVSWPWARNWHCWARAGRNRRRAPPAWAQVHLARNSGLWVYGRQLHSWAMTLGVHDLTRW